MCNESFLAELQCIYNTNQYKMMINFWQPLVNDFDLSDLLLPSVAGFPADWRVVAVFLWACVCESNRQPLGVSLSLTTSAGCCTAGEMGWKALGLYWVSKAGGGNICIYIPFLFVLQEFLPQTVAVLNKYSNLLTNSALCNCSFQI